MEIIEIMETVTLRSFAFHLPCSSGCTTSVGVPLVLLALQGFGCPDAWSGAFGDWRPREAAFT